MELALVAPVLSLGGGLSGMLGQPFMRHAFVAGTFVALANGLIGYFAVLRGQVFAGDAVSHAAFTGALAALFLGVDARLGLFAATIAVALGMGVIGRRGRADDVVIGGLFAWVLGLGALFLALYTTHGSGGNGAAGPAFLFGSIFGLSGGASWLAALIAGLAALALLGVARPLLFASIDEAVAAAQGVPVRALGLLFLVLLGVAAAEGAQVIGSLLVLGLLATPAATAQRLTDRPFNALLLSGALAVAAMWAGLALAYAVPRLPPSFTIIAVATSMYALVALLPPLWRAVVARRPARRPAAARG